MKAVIRGRVPARIDPRPFRSLRFGRQPAGLPSWRRLPTHAPRRRVAIERLIDPTVPLDDLEALLVKSGLGGWPS